MLGDARVELERCASGEPFNLLPLEARAVIDEMARLIEKEFVYVDLLAALEPFAYLSEVMEEGQVLNFRGVYVSHEQALAAARAIAKAKGQAND